MFFDNTVLDVLARGFVLSGVALIWIILMVRIVGLNSFSKMTNFDFVTTIAFGSLLAGAAQASDWKAFFQTLIATACLFLSQFTLSYLRRRSETVLHTIQNAPVYLMENGTICEEAMRMCRVSRSDLMEKLRESNVLRLSDVRAAVFETTGEVSVLSGDEVDEAMLEYVQRV
ncbi:DUF421 domain-containing protein [Sulfitobacter litoralis]|uniref:DUF421 domain-containing protein n=1 Tax=Sulfitobacter litoralis TaxID=335975 RepID=UPI002B265383|nr:YetF domain-containing protein [Sulfitobacter litoralis]